MGVSFFVGDRDTNTGIVGASFNEQWFEVGGGGYFLYWVPHDGWVFMDAPNYGLLWLYLDAWDGVAIWLSREPPRPKA